MSDVTFIEMGSGSAEHSSRFFAGLFGWRFHPIDDEGAAGGGWFETPTGRIGLHGNDPQWQMLPYFRVDNMDLAVERVRELGGEAEKRITNEPGFGRFCHCRDPQGMRFGLHQMLP